MGCVVRLAFGEVAGDVVFEDEESAEVDVRLKLPLGDVLLAEALVE